jgi:hypothetical protein
MRQGKREDVSCTSHIKRHDSISCPLTESYDNDDTVGQQSNEREIKAKIPVSYFGP